MKLLLALERRRGDEWTQGNPLPFPSERTLQPGAGDALQPSPGRWVQGKEGGRTEATEARILLKLISG